MLPNNCFLPLKYKCSHCGSDGLAYIPITVLVPNADDSSKRDYFFSRIHDYYKCDPINHFEVITGQCPHCGHTEPWQTDPQHYAKNDRRTSRLATLAVIAALVLAIVAASFTGKIIWIIPFLIFFMLLFFASLFLIDRLGRKRRAEKLLSFKALPPEQQPTWLLSKEEVLDILRDADKGTEFDGIIWNVKS